MIFYDPREPKPVIDALSPAGPVSNPKIEDGFGVDYLFTTSDGRLCGVQRKGFPSDFLSSITDSRWARQMSLMRGKLDEGLVVFEGVARWRDGRLVHSHSNFCRKRFRAICWAVERRFNIAWTASAKDTGRTILDWWGHISRTVEEIGTSVIRPKRPRTRFKDRWGREDREALQRDRMEQFLEGVGKISRGRARKILEHFGRLPLELTADLREVEGIGEVVAGGFEEFLGAEYPRKGADKS